MVDNGCKGGENDCFSFHLLAGSRRFQDFSGQDLFTVFKKKKSCTLHEDLQMPGTRHAGCPAKPLVVSLEMRSFHSKKEVRLQRGEFVRLHQYVGCSDPTEQNFVALPEQQALAVNLNA